MWSVEVGRPLGRQGVLARVRETFESLRVSVNRPPIRVGAGTLGGAAEEETAGEGNPGRPLDLGGATTTFHLDSNSEKTLYASTPSSLDDKNSQ